MPVRPPRALLRATLSAALLSVPLLIGTPSVPLLNGTPPAHAAEPLAARTTALPTEVAPASRPAPPAGDAPARRGPPGHLADTGSPEVARIGAAALVFLSVGALLVAAARRLRRR
ncbi:hypothetical protein ACH4FX_32610 [Streptomyces sp. NPDC018019]|uniref:hypothetical protein n=1 Tax=Streptomyces sp. NPDC018019 TaxID=3365030 RepID=UPI003799BE49